MSRYGPRCSGASRTVLSKAPRMLEVIGPEGEVFLEADLTISGRNCLDRPDIAKESKKRHYGKLQVLDPNGQDTAVAKNNNDSSQNPDDGLSETTEGDDEKQTNEEYVGKNVAPLELMTEFLRAVMSRNYTVAKKLCQLILIYEPENPEAKQFSSLIEEKLLMEKTHAGEEEEDEDEEEDESDDSSDDSEEDSSDDNDQSEDSSDESEDI
ncbi:glutamate-rich protein 2 isoform X3 [Dromiciops gliroides]|uniref:glutamate-rich protein 2 isoform X3 n=1 Tax=Dromiciops gliroides TaxID=33562 RepID=UPI001CC81E52|nr:glutamate-rich protein 2 isoform X3 [Dromiciops gliroides]